MAVKPPAGDEFDALLAARAVWSLHGSTRRVGWLDQRRWPAVDRGGPVAGAEEPGVTSVAELLRRVLWRHPTNDAPDAWPPYVEIAGVRVYVGMRSSSDVPASKAGRATTVTIAWGDLTNPDVTLGHDEATLLAGRRGPDKRTRD